MKILILGADGYLGWPTAMYLAQHGHDVAVLDSYVKRTWEKQLGIAPLFDLPNLKTRAGGFDKIVRVFEEDLNRIGPVLSEFLPDAIIHYAEQPSAPYSMISSERCIETQRNNVLGTLELLWAIREECPDAHLVKLGTMGEYGTPNIDIEEGYLEVEHNGRRDTVLFPKQPGSFYHLSKVHDSHNIFFACKTWGLRATDLNQGVVYGIETGEMYEEDGSLPERFTSFHYDAVFGTALNRFCAQVVSDHPITVYGSGHQKRAFLNIRDTLRCVELACSTPAVRGEMRIFNQFTEVFSIDQLAVTVSKAAQQLGWSPRVEHVDNPRVEADQHYYSPKTEKLRALGLEPRLLNDELVQSMLARLDEHKHRIDKTQLRPTVKWS